MIYLYAITDRPDLPLPVEPCLEGSPLFSLVHREIAAMVSFVTVANVKATETNLWQHEQVVETLMANRAVLPVRFGTVLRDESAVRTALATHYARFVAQLDRVRGRVEVGLRVLWRNEDDLKRMHDPGSSTQLRNIARQTGEGQAYMIGRLKQEHQIEAKRRQAEALADKLHFPLTQLARDSTRRVLITPELLLTAAYLLEGNQVSKFQEKVNSLSRAYPTLRFLCTGPWPAYAFVTATVPGIAAEEEREANV